MAKAAHTKAHMVSTMSSEHTQARLQQEGGSTVSDSVGDRMCVRRDLYCPSFKPCNLPASSHTCCVSVVVLQKVVCQNLDKSDVSKPSGYRQLQSMGICTTVLCIIMKV